MDKRPIKKAKVITPEQLQEQKKQQAMQFLAQRRESYAVNILCALLHNNPGVKPEDVVEKSVYTADRLLEKLFPINEDKAND